MNTRAAQALAAVELAYTLTPGDPITDAQRSTLRGFVGWGALAHAFDPHPAGEWADVADRLEEVLPADAWQAAADQTDTSFFTPAAVTEAVWGILRHVGFTGGRVLEPGAGAGAFLTAKPADMDAEFTGVEIDPTSSLIFRHLHPEAQLHESALERTPLRDDYFDAAIGNVPFGKARLSDRDGREGAIHNYFTARAIDAVRPGGYVVLVTSRYAIDSLSGIRDVLETTGTASLVGAVRLPSGAFAESGTDVVTDILVIQKDPSGTARIPAPWPADRGTVDYNAWGRAVGGDLRHVIDDGTNQARISNYWAHYPEHVAGSFELTGFVKAPLRVNGNAADMERAIGTMVQALPAITTDAPVDDLSDVVLADADGRKEGSYHLVDGAMHRVQGGKLAPVRGSKELSSLIELRDLALRLLAAESDWDAPDASMAVLRGQTRDAYTAYVAKFGHLNRGTLTEGAIDPETGAPKMGWRRPAMGGFRKDPDSALVFALEVFDQESCEAHPAPILLRRVNCKPAPVLHADTPAEALAISLGESGRVDLGRVASLLGLASEDDAEKALGDLVYDVPGRGHVAAAEALSGDVRSKHAAAVRAAKNGDEAAARYADALAEVIPADLGAGDIHIALGSPFVSIDDVKAFLEEEMGARWPNITHTAIEAHWEVEASGFDAEKALQWGTPAVTPAQLVQHALNNTTPTVTREVGSYWERRQERDAEATSAAQQKLELIQDRFSTWVWEDAERAQRVGGAYNRTLNSHRPRIYTGEGLTFPGMSAGFTPYPHQRAAVERIVTSERALIAHPVGSGKTSEFILAARTLRQFGLARKPMIAVPQHLLEQVAREAQQLFPSGRFLIATKDDLARDARRLFAARCATGDWDAVIITHSAFGSIPVNPRVERDWVEEQKMQLRLALRDAPERSRGAKRIASSVRSLDARLSKLRDGQADADAIFFDQLGVDHLMIDEAHYFRRLGTHSKSRDSGMPGGESKRATDLLMKVEHLANLHPGKPVFAGFTGTPWTNTLAETWVWQRYLQPKTLSKIGLLEFDAWVSAFIRYETNIEVAPDGSGFRSHRRPVGVTNVPELKTLLAQVADVLDPSALGLARPDVTRETVAVQPTFSQRRYVKDLAERADDLRSGSRGEDARQDDNMLVIVGDGRKVALDPQLVGIPDQSTKLAAAAERIAAAYRDGEHRTFGSHPAPGAFQLVFMDIGTPGAAGNQSYGRLHRLLTEQGVPAGRIRFIHDATTDKARAALFAACRNGDVSVLIASTEKAGVGTNVQTRLTHLHHIDAPWRPSDVTQRDGRGDRPGNLGGHVTVTRYVTEGTFDAYMWQTLEVKSRAFDALYATGTAAREMADVSQATLSFGEVKALASGNPMLLEQAKARAEVKKLQVMRAGHLQGVNKARATAQDLAQAAGRADSRLEAITEALSAATEKPEGIMLVPLRGRLEDGVRNEWVEKNRYSYGSRVGYRGITISLKRDASGERRVAFEAGWRTFAEVTVSAKTLRRGVDRTVTAIIEAADAAIDALAGQRAALAQDAAALRARSAEHTAAAAGAVFEQEAELQEAIARLATIDAQISDAVEAPAAASQAA